VVEAKPRSTINDITAKKIRNHITQNISVSAPREKKSARETPDAATKKFHRRASRFLKPSHTIQIFFPCRRDVPA
jgi:hypothetical protein